MNGYKINKNTKKIKLKELVSKLFLVGIIFTCFSILIENKNENMSNQVENELDYKMKLDSKVNVNNLNQLTENTISYVVGEEIEDNNLIYTVIDANNASVRAKNTKIENVTINEVIVDSNGNSIHVTSIQPKGFYDCDNITEISIPDSIVEIGESAFYICESLKKVKLSPNITKLPNSIFYGCDNLTQIGEKENLIDLSSIEELGEWAFYRCISITKVKLSPNITKLPSSIFISCYKLIQIGEQANLIDLSNIEELEESAFFSCESITRVKLSPNITKLPDSIFSGCCKLTQLGEQANLIDLSNIEELEEAAFSSCESITRVRLSPSIKKLPDKIFGWCYKLTQLGEKANIIDLSNIDEIGEYAFARGDLITTVELSPNITTLSSSIFKWCGNLTQIGKVENEIDLSNIKEIGEFAFHGCESITTVKLSKDLTILAKGIFEKCYKLTQIGDIENKIDLTNIVEIGSFALNGCSFESIIIPKSVTLIEEYAFKSVSINGNYILDTEFKLFIESKLHLESWDDYITDGEGMICYYSNDDKSNYVDRLYWHYVDGKPVIWAKNQVITFYDGDGPCKIVEYAFGEKVTYDGIPTKKSTDKYVYEFDKWDKEFRLATEDTIYTALFISKNRFFEKTMGDTSISLEPKNGFDKELEVNATILHNSNIYGELPSGKELDIVFTVWADKGWTYIKQINGELTVNVTSTQNNKVVTVLVIENGVYVTKQVKVENNKLSFETKDLSGFAILKDIPKSNSNYTVIIIGSISAVLVVSLAVGYIIFRKKRINKNLNN